MSRKIITLCGSIRFEEYFRLVNGELTMAGYVVLAPGFFNHSVLHEPKYNAEVRKGGLDELHLDKIRMSHAVFVLDVLGYMGKSTKGEINFAIDEKKSVYYWSKGDLNRLV